MNNKLSHIRPAARRLSACGLALLTALSAALPAGAAELSPMRDETYYAPWTTTAA